MIEIIALVYIFGIFLTFPLIRNAVRAKFADDRQSGKNAAAQATSTLVISYVISCLFWPIIAPVRIMELVKERNAIPQISKSRAKAAARRKRKQQRK